MPCGTPSSCIRRKAAAEAAHAAIAEGRSGDALDAYDAERLAREVAERCTLPAPLVLPLIPYGVSFHHEDFPGTIGVSNDALAKMVYDVGMSAARCGANKLVIINGHGGNSPALNHAAQMINRDAGIFVCLDTGDKTAPDTSRIFETPNALPAGQ